MNETYLIFARQWTSFKMHIPCVGDQIRNFQRQEKKYLSVFFSARLIIFKLHVNLGFFVCFFSLAWTYVVGVSHSPIATAFGIPSILNLPIFFWYIFFRGLRCRYILFFSIFFLFYIKPLWGPGLASFQSNWKKKKQVKNINVGSGTYRGVGYFYGAPEVCNYTPVSGLWCVMIGCNLCMDALRVIFKGKRILNCYFKGLYFVKIALKPW